MGALIGGWAVGPVSGRRPAGAVREAVHPRSGTRGVLVVVDARFSAGTPDADGLERAAAVAAPALVPLLDAGVQEDGTRWYVGAPVPAAVLDPEAGCSPRRAALIGEGVARALAVLHAAGVAHGLVCAQTVVPSRGRHQDGGSDTTLLLDSGLAALLGDGVDALATACGVIRPADRGPAADVHALGGLLLRMLSVAAPAGAALAALPEGLRTLLTAMLDVDPAARPTAAAVVTRLAALREGLPGTAPVPLPAPRTAPARAATDPVRPATGRVPVPGPVAAAPPPPPTPVRAPVRTALPILAPSVAPDAAHVLRTGPVPLPAVPQVADPRAPRGRALRRALVAVGGVGIAALLVGVVTHLPDGGALGTSAVAADAGGTLTGVGSAAVEQATSAAPAATPTPTRSAKHRAAPATSAATSSATASATPSSASAGTASRSATPTRSTTPSRSATPTRSASPTRSTSPSTTPPAASSPVASTPATSAPPAASDPTTSAPADAVLPTATDTASDAVDAVSGLVDPVAG